jgi:hypothetical protein
MSAPRLTEETVGLIISHIQTNIAQALTDVRADRPDNQVVTEIPASYFNYENAHGYQTPAIFVICETFDFKLDQYQANYINADAKINVSVLVEDKDKNNLTVKTWRYQSALHQLLAQTQLQSTDNKVKLTIKVMNATFSPLYSKVRNKDSVEAVFRKEVLLECEVNHQENY